MITPASSPVAGRTDKGSAVLDAFLESFFRLQPVTATFAGIHDYDNLLPDWSPDGLAAARDERVRLRWELAGAGLRQLSEDALVRRDWAVIDGALADACLEIQIAEDVSRHFIRGNPSLAIGEALFSLVSLAWDINRSPRIRFEAAIARLGVIAPFLEGVKQTLGNGAIPAAWKARCVRECEGGQALLTDLDEWLVADKASPATRRAFSDAAAHARVAIEAFRAFVVERATAPVEAYSAGERLLELVIRRGHWCETPLEHLQAEARDGMQEERQRLEKMLRASGVQGLSQVAERIANHHPKAGDVLRACEDAWDQARELADTQVTWPGTPVHYHAMPVWARRAAPKLYYLMYRSPAPMEYPRVDRYSVPVPLPDEDDASRAAFCRTWNHAAIKLNHVAHHGGLGHHVQNWHAARSKSRIGRIAAVDGANRIAMVGGGTMAEGWACYATELLNHLGWLTPDERISELHTQLRLMVRAVVDLELHTGRLSFDDAVKTHVQSAGLSPAAARAEVTKCSMFPGTASMYWLGLRGLLQLRQDEEAMRGAAFDLHAFHDAVLAGGSMPVLLVARLFAASRPE